MRWQSRGMSVAAISASTTGSPSVRLGTKWASNVDVQPVGAVHRRGLVGEMSEVGREDAGGDHGCAGAGHLTELRAVG